MADSADKLTTGPNYRAFRRHTINESIRIRLQGQDNFFSAIIDNYSDGGLYLKSPVSVDADALIDIDVSGSDLPEFESSSNSEAKVIWCRKIKGKDLRFGIGVKWLSLKCDWCNEKMLFKQIHRSEELIFLCPACYEEFKAQEKAPNDRLRRSAQRYLQGNVL